VAEVFHPGLVQPDVMLGPPAAELLAAGRELADQVGQLAVVGVTAGFGPQQRDGGVGDVVPAGVEVAGDRVEKAEPGQVRGAARVVEHW
jgi:hypothetical protein